MSEKPEANRDSCHRRPVQAEAASLAGATAQVCITRDRQPPAAIGDVV
jgi:hypothetical protein